MIPIKHFSLNYLCLWTICIFVLSGCSTPAKVVYLQDVQPDVTVALQETQAITLQPGDKLTIVVYSRDRELSQMFNLGGSASTGTSTNNYDRNSFYTVNDDGNIDMPILGPIHVAGLTRLEVADLIKFRLLAGKLVRDPTVTVEYAGMSYYVMGEVGSPGRKEIDRDRITLLEALSQAGDLTIQGRRDNILILRTEDDKQTPYRVDITQTNDLYASPVYYLKQNDLIYVEPNEMRINQSKLNANTLRTPGFWFGATSFILSLILLFAK